MLRKNNYLDFYVLWSYLILEAVSIAVFLAGYEDEMFIWVVALVVYGGVFWYWYKDKDYTVGYWLLGEVSMTVCRSITAFIFFMFPYDYNSHISIYILKYAIGIVFSFMRAYFYQLFKIKSYKNKLHKK